MEIETIINIVMVCVLIAIVGTLFIGIRRNRKLNFGTKEEKKEELRRGDKIVEFAYRKNKMIMTESQKEFFDSLSRAEKGNVLKQLSSIKKRA